MLHSKEVLAGEFPSSRRYGTQPDGFFHNGIDWKAPTGTPVLARHSGVIKINGTNPPGQDFGNYVRMTYDQVGLDGWFAHLQSFARSVGEHVNAGEIIGVSNNSGMSTGPHLHYSESATNTLHWIDPDTTTEGGEEMTTRPIIDALVYAFFERTPTDTEYKRDVDKPIFDVLALYANSDERKLYLQGLTTAKDQANEVPQLQTSIAELNAQVEDLKTQLANLPGTTPNPAPVPSQGLTGYSVKELVKELLNRLFNLKIG